MMSPYWAIIVFIDEKWILAYAACIANPRQLLGHYPWLFTHGKINVIVPLMLLFCSVLQTFENMILLWCFYYAQSMHCELCIYS